MPGNTEDGGSARRRPSAIALAFAPIPGVGHWVAGCGGRGLLAFMLLAAGVNLILLSDLVAPVVRLSPVAGWALAGASVLYSLVDVPRIVLKRRRAASAS